MKKKMFACLSITLCFATLALAEEERKPFARCTLAHAEYPYETYEFFGMFQNPQTVRIRKNGEILELTSDNRMATWLT